MMAIYTLQAVIGIHRPKKKMLSVSKKAKFSVSEMMDFAYQYAIDHQINPGTVGINQFKDGELIPGHENHYLSDAEVNSMGRRKNPTAAKKKVSLLARTARPVAKKPAKKNPSPKRIGVKGLKNFIVQIRASKSDDWWTDEVFTDRDEALRFAGKMHKEAPGMHIRVMMDKG